MTGHARPKPRWRRYLTTGLWFTAITLFAYFTLNANPIAAGIVMLTLAAIIGYNLYLEDRNRP